MIHNRKNRRFSSCGCNTRRSSLDWTAITWYTSTTLWRYDLGHLNIPSYQRKCISVCFVTVTPPQLFASAVVLLRYDICIWSEQPVDEAPFFWKCTGGRCRASEISVLCWDVESRIFNMRRDIMRVVILCSIVINRGNNSRRELGKTHSVPKLALITFRSGYR